MDYYEVLLLVHVISAIAGFGVTFSFGVLGPLAGKLGGPQGLGLLKGIEKVVKTLVYPAIVVQLLTGVLLIFEAGWDNDFFSHTWLWIAILIFLATVSIAVFLQAPTVEKMIELAESNQAQSPEFGKLAKGVAARGPILSVMLLVIIYLMVVKPGS